MSNALAALLTPSPKTYLFGATITGASCGALWAGDFLFAVLTGSACSPPHVNYDSVTWAPGTWCGRSRWTNMATEHNWKHFKATRRRAASAHRALDNRLRQFYDEVVREPVPWDFFDTSLARHL